jgi:hypothetical protein
LSRPRDRRRADAGRALRPADARCVGSRHRRARAVFRIAARRSGGRERAVA